MKQYISPKIKSIALDPDQALLQVCKVGGIYMYGASTACVATDGTGFMPSGTTCATGVRGVTGGTTTTKIFYSASPS